MKKLSSFKIDENLMRDFKSVCSEQGKTMTQVVEKLIQDYCCSSSVKLYFIKKQYEKKTVFDVCKESEIIHHVSDKSTLSVFDVGLNGLSLLSGDMVRRIMKRSKEETYENI